MDFPISVPGIGLVDGKFIDEDALSGTPGSLIPSVWGNSITLEILNVIEAASLTPDEDNNAQLLQAINSILSAATPEATEIVLGLIRRATQAEIGEGTNDTAAVSPKKLATAVQNQTLTAFTTAGAAPAFTLTPSPAIDAYAVSQRFSVKFSATAPTGGTLDVSGKGPKNLKQYDSTGAKVATVIGANQITDVVYDGTDMIVLDPLPAAAGNLIGIQGSAKNLIGSASGLSAAVTYSADEIAVESATNTYQILRGVSISPSLAASGANGLDTGTSAANTWYSVWVIWNGTTTAGLLSLSATAPTIPAGYTHKARVGWVRADATANKYPLAFTQVGRRAQYAALRDMATGLLSQWSAIAVGAFVPPTAGVIIGRIQNSNAICAVAPNAGYDGYGVSHVYLPSGNGTAAQQFDMAMESSNIYGYSTASGSKISALGWEDTL